MQALRKSFEEGRLSRYGRANSSLLPERSLLHFSLPSRLPAWPSGTGFASGHISIGEIELAEISTFEEVWSTRTGGKNNHGVAFFKPINIPAGYFCLGYYCQVNTGSLDGCVLLAKDCGSSSPALLDGRASREATGLAQKDSAPTVRVRTEKPALSSPVDYELDWSSRGWVGQSTREGFFWLPCAPDGYNALGYVVTNTAKKPSAREVMCVRTDLTDSCKTTDAIWCTDSKSPFTVWDLYPAVSGRDAQGIAVGTFCCSSTLNADSSIPVACLKNTGVNFDAMPTLDQIHTIIQTYGPVIFFHPDETYFPSSVSWLFEQGALLHMEGEALPVKVSFDGSNLPVGGLNNDDQWIALPDDGTAETTKKGNLASAEVYVQVKPMLGGTFTDLSIWIYYPFNGPSTAKLGMVNVPLGKIGEHVSDWEHITVRVSNFSGELRKVYFAQHSGGLWVKASELEYVHGNKVAVYSSKHGHASYPHAGLELQGDKRLGVGIRNDTAQSDYSLDSGKKYQIVSAEYLHVNHADGAPVEPMWLHYACKWGPKVQYDSRAELDKIFEKLPKILRSSLQSLVNKFPHELSGQQGPCGPKFKDYWLGDERVKS